ncbi:MAG TPA: type II CAAX endopeptidase family protein, partial [Thermoanaerobaculia bacterium]|nr:type II CAAX endopeptidase family protein [Thermoanaerobaculia bacterium]
MLTIYFVLFVAFVFPLLDLFLYPRVRPGARARYHLIGSAWLWLMAAGTIAVMRGHPWHDLRLDVPSPIRLAAGFALVIAYGAHATKQTRALLRKPARLRALLQKHAYADALVPHTAAEMKTFAVLSVSAGFCEEVVYRGFMLWCATTWIGLWPALLATSVLFGAAHAYLGKQGMLSAAVGGLLFGVVAIGSASLWPAIVLHAATDLFSGDLLYRASRLEPFEQVRHERLGEAVGNGAD